MPTDILYGWLSHGHRQSSARNLFAHIHHMANILTHYKRATESYRHQRKDFSYIVLVLDIEVFFSIHLSSCVQLLPTREVNQ